MLRTVLFWSLVLLVRVSRAQTPAPLPPDPASPTPAPARTVLLVGPTVLAAADGRTYFGADWAMARLVSPRLALGFTLSISGRRAVDTAYGFRASAPAVGLYSLAASSRYALANTTRCRVELLNGLGYGAAGLFDRDRMGTTTTYTRNGPVTSTQPVRVALNEQWLVEAGVAFTAKLGRGPWLTAQLSRRQLLGGQTFGPSAGFSHWAGTLGVGLPYNW